MSRLKNIILTGDIGCGKSTLVKKILSELNIPFTGIFCHAVFRDDVKVGYGLKMPGRKELQIYAHIDIKSALHMQNFGIELEPFEKAAQSIEKGIESAAKLFVIDEVGIMEKNVIAYQRAVDRLLDSEIAALMVVQRRADYFWKRIKSRKDVIVFKLADNHLIVQQQIKQTLKKVTDADRRINSKIGFRGEIEHGHHF
jgi:nucleoside-triphosphatase